MRKNTFNNLNNLLPILGLTSSFVLMGTLRSSPVQAISFNIDWTGIDGYTMTGMFSYDDTLIDTGAITGSSLDSFIIEVFQNSTSLGTWQQSDGGTFNFNFDTTTETFLVGGAFDSPTGQRWGTDSTTVGFSSGSAGQVVYQGGAFISSSTVPIANSTLTATRKVTTTVPEPGTMLALLGLGLGFVVGKNKKQA